MSEEFSPCVKISIGLVILTACITVVLCVVHVVETFGVVAWVQTHMAVTLFTANILVGLVTGGLAYKHYSKSST